MVVLAGTLIGCLGWYINWSNSVSSSPCSQGYQQKQRYSQGYIFIFFNLILILKGLFTKFHVTFHVKMAMPDSFNGALESDQEFLANFILFIGFNILIFDILYGNHYCSGTTIENYKY